MTKRFTMNNPNDWGFPITDNLTGKQYSCDSNMLMKDLCKVVNGIVDENEQLKKDNEQLKQTIQEAYETERTRIGQNVLKQLLERLE